MTNAIANGRITFEESEFTLVSSILAQINPGRGGSADHIKAHIMNQIEPGQLTTLSTGGWVASTYLTHDGTTHVRLALAAYTVALFLNGGISPYKEGAKHKA